ncbi:hypothetical protein Z517_09183 [Fonsecaea pedrosoi CBS 271.37]|uniref:Uncharacterized protein n=1 Tax=Fonsecaea pedrosoi CBS 271.37 TaxID=1442368 RepID=A0A0D2GWJ4_9EURO|nr:uncharacterized protein Z517_09183 [Fonsecaea pedrosoi CBS 271.37]KIW76739.1 hypothetical protein Z517_09183 [Fonsecaea pedrosoi CBS 271.37]
MARKVSFTPTVHYQCTPDFNGLSYASLRNTFWHEYIKMEIGHIGTTKPTGLDSDQMRVLRTGGRVDKLPAILRQPDSFHVHGEDALRHMKSEVHGWVMGEVRKFKDQRDDRTLCEAALTCYDGLVQFLHKEDRLDSVGELVEAMLKAWCVRNDGSGFLKLAEYGDRSFTFDTKEMSMVNLYITGADTPSPSFNIGV